MKGERKVGVERSKEIRKLSYESCEITMTQGRGRLDRRSFGTG